MCHLILFKSTDADLHSLGMPTNRRSLQVDMGCKENLFHNYKLDLIYNNEEE